MFDLFTDIFTLRQSALTRMDPRIKMLITISCLLAVIFSTKAAFPIIVMAGCLLTMGLLKVPVKLVLIRLAIPLVMVAVLLVLQSLMNGPTHLFDIWLFKWRLFIFREGLLQGILMGSRVLGAVSIILLFSSITPAHDVFRSLKWARLPSDLIEVAMLMYRYIFALLDQASDVSEAQRMRLGYVGIGRSLASVGALAGTVIIRSIDQSTRTHEAMMLRGYTGAVPFEPMPSIPRRDRKIASLTLILVILGFALQEWGGR